MTEHVEAAQHPALSVVVVVSAGGRSIKRLLKALERQKGAPAHLEVIIAADERHLAEPTLRCGAATVRMIRAPGETHPAALRALGVRLATAPIIACTEDHCIPVPDWCAQIVAAHSETALAIGGAIRKLQPDTAMAWATYLLDYGRYAPPLDAGPAAYLSDCNVSYKRSGLEQIASVWRDAFHETSVHDAIRAQAGHDATVLAPSIVVLQSRHPDLASFIGERFTHGRLYARLRAAGSGRGQRWRYAIISLGVGPLFVLRALKHALRGENALIGALRALPLLIIGALCWSVGETTGALWPREQALTSEAKAP